MFDHQSPSRSVHKSSQRKVLSVIGLSALFLLSLNACSTSGLNNTRRIEAGEARALQEVQKPVALHKVPSNDARLTEMETIWVDASRQRAVPARVFVPEQGNGPHPVVIFSHGLGGSRLSYSQLGRHWASLGFVAVHLQHAGSDRAIWTASGWAVLSALKTAASTDNAIDRARDVSFAIDQLGQELSLSSKIDLERIAVAGHSFGANTALLCAGAQFKVDGKMQAFGDPRIKAAIILSPPSVPANQDPIYVYNPIRIPTLHLTGTRDDTPIPGLSTMANQRSEAFDSMVATPRYLAVYEGGRHSMFHDRTIDKTSTDIKTSTKELSTLFLRSTLMGDDQAREVLAKSLQAQRSIIAHWDAKPAR
jgi:predicted dienelactone hydrolase